MTKMMIKTVTNIIIYVQTKIVMKSKVFHLCNNKKEGVNNKNYYTNKNKNNQIISIKI